jgi:chemotaxis protein CheC
MSTAPYTSDQRDALQEVVNIAMGQGGASLAVLLDTFVTLSVPRIRIVESSAIAETVAQMVGGNTDITAVRQGFFSYLRGEAIVIYGQSGCHDLADLMGYDASLDAAIDQELLLDVSNLLVGACMTGIAKQLGADIGFSAPSIMAERCPVYNLFKAAKLNWTHALLVEINFSLEEKGFAAHLVILMPEESIMTMRDALDRFLESL